MKAVIQNSKFKMQTRQVVVAVCVFILHFAFCIAPARAQLQPGVPGQMGHQTGIVASNRPASNIS